MSLVINGTERDTLIIGKSIFKYAGEWTPALAHNATYRGQSLGSFNETFANDINNSTFNNMYVGDTFTQNGHTYKIGGFNYLFGADDNVNLSPHLLMITNMFTYPEMNPSATTSGGFAGSNMWKSYFPTVVKQLQTDFGSHLLTWNEYLTTGVDGDAANQGAFSPVQASMMNTVMYWGSPGKYSTLASNGTNYNIGIETKQLPIMKLHTDEQKNGGQRVWLRDVSSASNFAYADDDGTESSNEANSANGFGGDYIDGVRAFFLIG